jgi:hypothetical protein
MRASIVAFLIDLFSFPPVSCTYDPDSLIPAIAHSANAVISLLGLAMAYILGYYAVRIAKGILSQIERDAMLQLVLR